MNIKDTQIPKEYRDIIENELSYFSQEPLIETYQSIPSTPTIPIEDPLKWIKVMDVICVFIDMKGSTKLSAGKHDKSTASIFRLFTNTAIRIFHEIDAPYIDIKGDGVFALFNKNQIYTALVAAVLIQTFIKDEFLSVIKKKYKGDTGVHIGIDQKTILVRKLGFKRYGDRTDRQNEVWAGKTVNIAAKLASLAEENEVYVSKRYFNQLKSKYATHSCTCSDKKELWTEVEVDEEMFGFDTAYSLSSHWCPKHGTDYIDCLLELDA